MEGDVGKMKLTYRKERERRRKERKIITKKEKFNLRDGESNPGLPRVLLDKRNYNRLALRSEGFLINLHHDH